MDVLHGEPVADPYRRLEDPDAPDTVAWVVAQNVVAEAHLAALPDRVWFCTTMDRVVRRPRAGVPYARGGPYLATRNDGIQNQDVTYVADCSTSSRPAGAC